MKLLQPILKSKLKTDCFALVMSLLNFLFFHVPFFSFVFKNLDFKSFNGAAVIVSLCALMIVVNFFVFYLFLFLFRFTGKILLSFFFILNAVAVYFVNSYGVIIDESMIGNVFNTSYEESSSFFSFKMALYVLAFGGLPAIWILFAEIEKTNLKKNLKTSFYSLLFILILVFVNGGNWLWIDKNSKRLGGLAMPWSYAVNSSLFLIHQHKKTQKEILLPDAVITDTKKSVVILVIGESARSGNFSLYGYKKKTNPCLSKTKNVYHFNAVSSATYTTAGVKSILDYKITDQLYEILPNYLFRNNVDVIWRTANWGEPPVHINKYRNREYLKKAYSGEDCEYDGLLVKGLKEEILASKKNKILVILHTSTSHGPSYSKKYPLQFEIFKPVCSSVELSKCSEQELINAYDNTIVYTDYILHSVIESLKDLKQFESTMMYVSDHGESLGEHNLYMHGLPISIAPREQYEIPFIVWTSDNSRHLKQNKLLSQGHVFHSVLNFLSIDSPIYNEELNIFK